jgi:DNA-binding MarR family transcriptional regulator
MTLDNEGILRPGDHCRLQVFLENEPMEDNTNRECAAMLLDTLHMVKRTLGAEMKKRSALELTMHQFRAMNIVSRHQGASLSLVSEHMGATISATSKLIDGLAERGYVQRRTAEDDRRRLILQLTNEGTQALERVHMEGISRLAEKLKCLSPGECAMLKLAMDMLRSALGSSDVGKSEPQMHTDGHR